MHESSIADGTPTSGVDRARSLYLFAGVQLSADDVAIVDLGPSQIIRAFEEKDSEYGDDGYGDFCSERVFFLTSI